MAVLPQSYELTDVDKLSAHPENPRRGDVGALSESVRSNGFYGALIVQRSTGYVLAGNHRLQAARSEGIEEVPVLFVDVDDAQARRILLADNRVNDLAGYDTEQLVSLLGDMPDLAGTGYSTGDLDDLVRQLDKARPLQGDEDRVRGDDGDEEIIVVREGDVWLLGLNRLVCGSGDLDPSFCQWLCTQWQKRTKIEPVLEATMTPYSFAGGA